MSRRDRKLLHDMGERELADLGISRSDLPRVFAGCAFGSHFCDSILCSTSPPDADIAPLYVRAQLLDAFVVASKDVWARERGLVGAFVRVSAALSAVLLTGAMVYGVA